MVQLCGKPEQEITDELAGAIFRNPVTQQWETSDEYLSGNVREKLATAETFAANHAEYQINVDYLKRVQPKDLDASEIEVRLGANWVKPEYITQFMKWRVQTVARKSRKNLPQPEQAAASVLLPELEKAKMPAAIYGRLSVEDEETEGYYNGICCTVRLSV